MVFKGEGCPFSLAYLRQLFLGGTSHSPHKKETSCIYLPQKQRAGLSVEMEWKALDSVLF